MTATDPALQSRHFLPSPLLGIASGLGAVTIWAGSFVLTRLGVKTTLNAYDIIALRFAAASALLLPVLWLRGIASSRLGWSGLTVLIAGGGAPYALLIALGLGYAPASQAAALVPGVMAALAAVLGAVLLHEALAFRQAMGIGAILLGSILVAWFAAKQGEAPGAAAFVLAAVLWAAYVVVLRRSKVGALHATAIVAVSSAALYLPIYALWLPIGLSAAPASDIATQAIYQGGLTTVVGLMAFNRAVALLGVAAGAALPALIPVLTLILAALLLEEIPSLPDIAGAALIGVGVLLATPPSSARGKEGNQ